MKILKSLSFIFVLTLTIAACEKDPSCLSKLEANYTPQYDHYYAGQTIYLRDTSIGAYSWKWEIGKREIYYSKNLIVQTDSNDNGHQVNFNLEVSSKDGRKSVVSGGFNLLQAIFPSDYFSFGNTIYKLSNKYVYLDSNKLVLGADRIIENNAPFHGVEIIFPDTSAPAAGTYLLQANDSTLTSGAAINFTDDVLFSKKYKSISGQLHITSVRNGKTHAVFTNIPVKKTGDTITTLLSGDLILSNKLFDFRHYF